MQSINFQIIDWYSNDMYPTLSESDDSDSDESQEKKYSEDESEFKIFLFGKDMSGKSYSLMVNDFTPYFYVQVPDNFKSSQLPIFEKWIKYGTYGDELYGSAVELSGDGNMLLVGAQEDELASGAGSYFGRGEMWQSTGSSFTKIWTKRPDSNNVWRLGNRHHLSLSHDGNAATVYQGRFPRYVSNN